MNYAIARVSNGNYNIESEHGTDLQAAIVAFHGLCRAYWNAGDVITGTIAIVDENLDVVDGYIEHIKHPIESNVE